MSGLPQAVAAGLGTGRLELITLNRSRPGGCAPAFLAFPAGAAEPVAFVRAATGERARSLEIGHDNLTYLGGRVDSVPRPLGLWRHGRYTVQAETAIVGARMKDLPPTAYFRSGRFRRNLREVESWLAALPREGRLDVAGELERYRLGFTISPKLAELFGQAEAALEDVPGALWHGDFCTANLILPDTGPPAVVDWEDPRVHLWPLAELLTFVTSTWCTPYAKGREALARNYEALWFERHAYSGNLREAVGRYLDALGIRRELAVPLAAVSWACLANRKREELRPGVDPDRYRPLVMLDRAGCLNLERLAERGEGFLPG